MVVMRKRVLVVSLILAGACQPVMADRSGLTYPQLNSP